MNIASRLTVFLIFIFSFIFHNIVCAANNDYTAEDATITRKNSAQPSSTHDVKVFETIISTTWDSERVPKSNANNSTPAKKLTEKKRKKKIEDHETTETGQYRNLDRRANRETDKNAEHLNSSPLSFERNDNFDHVINGGNINIDNYKIAFSDNSDNKNNEFQNNNSQIVGDLNSDLSKENAAKNNKHIELRLYENYDGNNGFSPNLPIKVNDNINVKNNTPITDAKNITNNTDVKEAKSQKEKKAETKAITEEEEVTTQIDLNEAAEASPTEVSVEKKEGDDTLPAESKHHGHDHGEGHSSKKSGSFGGEEKHAEGHYSGKWKHGGEDFKKYKKSGDDKSLHKGGKEYGKYGKDAKGHYKHGHFEGKKYGKKSHGGSGGQGGKKGTKYYKDKGYKKKGFKNVYHKEEYGDHKTYFDEFRDKDFKKKWKGFNDHYDYKGGKKWKGTDGKQYHKKKAVGDHHKKYGKGSYKKTHEDEYKKGGDYHKKGEGKKHNSGGHKSHKGHHHKKHHKKEKKHH